MNPPNGRYSSKIKKIAPETASAHRHRVAITVALRGAKRPKLKKLMVSQKTRITSNGLEIDKLCCSNINQRVCAISATIPTAAALIERWVSFCGESL